MFFMPRKGSIINITFEVRKYLVWKRSEGRCLWMVTFLWKKGFWSWEKLILSKCHQESHILVCQELQNRWVGTLEWWRWIFDFVRWYILCWFPYAAFEICGLYFERITLKVSFGESVYFFPSIFVLAPFVSIIYISKVILIWRLCVKPCLSSGCSTTEKTSCHKTFGKFIDRYSLCFSLEKEQAEF